MPNEAQERLTLLALGIRGDQPVDSEQPPLPDGVHLRWFPAQQEDGLPWNGFYLFRRESQPTRSVCLSTQLGDIRPGQTKDLRLPTKLGTLSSAQPLLFTDDFAPAGTVEVDLHAPLRFDLPDGVTAGRVSVRVGFRAGEAPTTGRSIDVDFRQSPAVERPNPVVEQGVSFTVSENIGGAPIPLQFVQFDLRLTIGTGTGMLGPIVDIKLPCPTKKVTLQMSTSPSPAVRPVSVQAFNQDGTLAQGLQLSTGLDAVVLEGEAITRIQIIDPGTDLMLHRIFFDCNAAGPASISVAGIAQIGTVVSGVTIIGDPGQVVAGTLEPQGSAGLTAITISAGNTALIDICYVPVQQSETFGWQELPKFSYPLCLPVADAGYPCPGKPATSIDAKTLALSRVTYPAPAGWDQDFPSLHDELAALVHGGPAGQAMADVEQPTLAGTPLSPSTQSDIPTLPGLKPLDLIFLASLHPAIAQMLGLYFVDQSALPDVSYDYLLLGDPTSVLGGSATSALDWLAFTPDHEPVWMQTLLNQSTAPRPQIAPPGKPSAYALPGMATRAIDGSLPVQAAGSLGLWWPLPPDPTDEQPQPDRIVFYYPRRVFLGATRPAGEPDPLQYTTRLSAVLVSEPDPSAPPIARSSEWPPPSVALYVVDSNLAEGWYSYRLAGQDLFGRRSPLSAPAAWFQWDPVPPTPTPWYYQPSGNKSIDPFAVALLDKMPPPTPLGVEAWALDPDDQWVLADAAYDAWRASDANLVGLRVRWRWTLMQQIQAPDTHTFRLYYQPGRWNALLGNVETVTAASATQSDAVLDFADAHAANAFAGTRLRVGNSDFAVIGSQPGVKLRVRVQNIGANNDVGPLPGKPCTIAIPETHALWVDTGVAATWAKRLAVVPYEPPARTVVDPSKDAAGLLLTSEVFNAAPAIVAGATVTLPSPADLSGIQPWIDFFWLRDGNGVEQTHRIVRYDPAAATRTITLETVPTITPASWMVGRPAREYDVFLPAPDIGPGQPFEPSLAEPSVYAQIAVSAADDKTHVTDTFPGGTLVGNESHLSPSATVYRVRQRLDEVPELPQLDDRLVATPADYHSRSYTTFRFAPVQHLKIHILRALDDTLFQRDWLVRETRKALDPAKHPDAFPETWNTARQQSAATALNLIGSEAAYTSLPSDAWDVLSRLPGNERAAGNKPILQNADLKARDWLVRRTHSSIALTDTDLFPAYWTSATRLAAFGEVNNLAAPADYPALPDNALRLLAALPGNESAFAQVTIHPFDMSDPEIQDQRRPDDKATYPPDPTLRAYMDTLPGRATNRYFYRASFVDGAQNQGALSLPGPPVYLPKVEPPRAPVITKVIGGDRQITIQWAANREPDLSEYRIYRAVTKEPSEIRTMVQVHSETATQTGSTSEISWTDIGLLGLVPYYYAIIVVDTAANVSAPSAIVTARAYDESLPAIPELTAAWAPPAIPTGVRLGWTSDDETLLEYRDVGSVFWASTGAWRAPGPHDEILGVDPARSWVFRLRVRHVTGAVLAGSPIELDTFNSMQ